MEENRDRQTERERHTGGSLKKDIDSLEKMCFHGFVDRDKDWMLLISRGKRVTLRWAEKKKTPHTREGALIRSLFCVRYCRNSCVCRRAKLPRRSGVWSGCTKCQAGDDCEQNCDRVSSFRS